jgi:hypothetical protein
MDVKWAITEDQLIGPAIAFHQLKDRLMEQSVQYRKDETCMVKPRLIF